MRASFVYEREKKRNDLGDQAPRGRGDLVYSEAHLLPELYEMRSLSSRRPNTCMRAFNLEIRYSFLES